MPNCAPRLLLRLLSCLLLLPASGCLTAMLWEGDSSSYRVVLSEHDVDAAITVRADPEVAGALRLAASRWQQVELPAVSGLSQRESEWRLRPRRQGIEALAILDGAGALHIEDLRLAAWRETANGVLTTNDARLELIGRASRDEGVERLSAAGLSPATLLALQPVAAADFLVGHEPGAASPLLAECIRRLRVMDPRVWLPDGSWPARVGAMVWADDAEVLTGARAARVVAGWDVDGDGLVCRLDALSRLRVIVAVEVADGREFYSLRPDRVWLWSLFDHAEAGRLIHSSLWEPEILVAASGEAGGRVLATGTLALKFIASRYEDRSFGNIALKVLATPFALAADAAVGVLYLVALAVTSRDDC